MMETDTVSETLSILNASKTMDNLQHNISIQNICEFRVSFLSVLMMIA
jgi:hypothetical protein